MNARLLSQTTKTPVRKPVAQAMVEFALVLPILLLIIFGVIEFGRLFYAWIIIENASRFGVRYATTGSFNSCDTNGDGVVDSADDLNGNGYLCDNNRNDEAEIDAARIPSIKNETRNSLFGLTFHESITQNDQGYLKIVVCSNRDDPPPEGTDDRFIRPRMDYPTYGDCQDGEDAGAPGQHVYVSVDYNFTFLVLPLFGFDPMMHLASYRMGTVEMFRTSRIVNTPPGGIVVAKTFTSTPSFTNTPTPTNTSTPTNTPTPTDTPTPTYTPSDTPTPSNTPSPTSTPQPDCSKLIINRTRFSSDRFEVRVQNDNLQPAYLINSTLTWDLSYTPSMYLDFFRFGTITYYNPRNNPPPPEVLTSPISAAAPAIPLDPGGVATQQTWAAKFNNPTFIGLYRATLTFDFPGWGTCVLTTSIFNNSPTPSFTPSITRTPSRTLTPSMTFTPSKTFTPSRTFTPSKTRTPRPPTNTPTNTATRTATPRATNTRTPSFTPTRTLTPSITPRVTNTPTPSRTRTPPPE